MSEWKKVKLGGTEMSKESPYEKLLALLDEYHRLGIQLGRICNPSTSNISIYNAKK